MINYNHIGLEVPGQELEGSSGQRMNHLTNVFCRSSRRQEEQPGKFCVITGKVEKTRAGGRAQGGLKRASLGASFPPFDFLLWTPRAVLEGAPPSAGVEAALCVRPPGSHGGGRDADERGFKNIPAFPFPHFIEDEPESPAGSMAVWAHGTAARCRRQTWEVIQGGPPTFPHTLPPSSHHSCNNTQIPDSDLQALRGLAPPPPLPGTAEGSG